jgi:outer membrane protein TolC
LVFVSIAGRAAAQPTAPLTLAEVLRIATEQRDELAAAHAAIRAAEQRPAVVSALEDPMVSVSFDHIPFMGGGADWSVTVEQRVPLSSVRTNRRASAVADLQRLRAEAGRTELDVHLEAVTAFLMLYERRRMGALLATQVELAEQVVAAANARYASGNAPQSDVLRGEVEVARLRSVAQAIVGEVRAAEAMLNTSIGRSPATAVAPLAPLTDVPVPTVNVAIERAVAARPELAAGRAAIARAEADVLTMQAMTRPMLSVRTGPAYTMSEGQGWMAMVGLSVPLWRDKQRASVAEAQAMRAMFEADVRAMRRMVEGETAVAVDSLRAAAGRATAFRTDVIPRARMAVDSAVTAYAAGRVPLVSVIESLQAQWSLELELVDAETQQGVARARLARATGSFEGMFQ